jgi:pimeloyl-ACP methyl ester carboxylesterase
MPEPRRRSLQCVSPRGLHRVAYLEWGDPRNTDVLVCVHGLTRVARDFERLAAALVERYRVVCPDVAGRGDSDWLPDPMLYQLPQYVSDMVALIARLDVATVHWVGTSMGGLIGMALAAYKSTPIAKLVLNDVGPLITRVSLERIAGYVGKAPAFASIEEADAYLRRIHASFGPHSDAEWRFMTEVTVRRNSENATDGGADGEIRLGYDPAIGEALRRTLPAADLELWPLYDAIRCPTLVVRGAQSDLLTHATAEAMTRRGPNAKLVEIAGVGHAPSFLHDEVIAPVRDFLLAA